MPKQRRFKTKYPGVYYVEGTQARTNNSERIFYISFYKNGKRVEEKAGRQYRDDMTGARANRVRSQKIDGVLPTNMERRKAIIERKSQEAQKWTINRLWEEYEQGRKPGKSLSTDAGRFKKYLKEPFGSLEPKDIISLDIDRLRISLLKKKSPQTTKHVLSLLTWIVNFGTGKGLCEGISFKIKKPQVNNMVTEDLNSEQLEKLFKAIEKDTHPQAGPMMKMALLTGMRRGELFKLKWEHVNFDKDYISIVDPKGGPDQKIPLNEPARKLLEGHPRSSEYVFPGRGGQQRADIKKALNSIKTAAELPKAFRPLHGLRHTFASMLASSGKVDLYQLQKLLGHKSPIMTQRYAHLRDESLRKASTLAGEIIDGIEASGKKVASIKEG